MSENRETWRAPGAYLAMDMDDDACYRAFPTRDARFDGRLFVGGEDHRHLLPADLPGAHAEARERDASIPTAAAAQEAGFRPCLRCRPETSPDLGAWRGTSNTVSRALALIEAGALDDGDVDAPGRRGWASASGSCGGCSASTSAPRRSRWPRPGGCCWPSS